MCIVPPENVTFKSGRRHSSYGKTIGTGAWQTVYAMPHQFSMTLQTEILSTVSQIYHYSQVIEFRVNIDFHTSGDFEVNLKK